MALIALEVYRSMNQYNRVSNYVTPVCWVVPTDQIKAAIPSVCKTDLGPHGLVNSLVVTEGGTPGNSYNLYCSQTTAEIAALS